MKNKRFDIIEWEQDEEEGLALRHCMDCQPVSDPEIKKDIEDFIWRFKLKAVTTGLCNGCYNKRMEEYK